MNRVGTLLVVASFVGFAAVVGCSNTAPDEPIYSLMGSDPADGGDSDNSIKLTGDDDDDDNTSSSSSSGKVSSKDGGAKSDGGASSSGGAKDGGGTSSSGGTPPPPPVDPCKDTTCGTAIAEPSMSGDTGSATKTLTGATSRWFTVRVTEDYHSILIGQQLSLRATLTSPAGANFDLYLYRPDDDVTECSKVRAKSENATGVDTAKLWWGETDGDPNGEDDSRTVTVEVRQISTAASCDPTATWSLALESDVQ